MRVVGAARLAQACARAQAYAARTRTEAGVARPAGGAWWRVSNADGERAKVYIYDYIDPWGVTAQDFATALDSIAAPNIDLHINSGGGDVFDGYAIYAALKAHPAEVTAHIDGLAASAASFIAMSAEEILISKPARMMIHDAAGLVYGNAADMRMLADLLDEISGDVAQIYADRAGGKADDWREAMQANGGFGTWYSSAQAVEKGLADRIDDGTPTGEPATAPESPAQDSSESTGAQDARSQLVRAGARHFPKG